MQILLKGGEKESIKLFFINKLLDAAQEAAETQTWLDFALHCEYSDDNVFRELYEKYEHIFAMLSTMEKKADAFCK